MRPRGRPARSRGNDRYDKPALDEAQLLANWHMRGLDIPDEQRALRYLRHIGYYRLSPYVRSFEGAQRDVLVSGAQFDNVLDLYVFDRQLRLLALDALERIEVAVRASLSDHMSRAHGPHWFEKAVHFSDDGRHSDFIDEVERLVNEQLRRAPERPEGAFVSALEHYVTRYREPRLPPSWLVLEEITFGTLQALYANLASRQDRTAIASSLGLNDPLLQSWLRTWQRVRNIAAHHGRLWNRGLGVNPKISTAADVRWLEDRALFDRESWRRQRLYPVLVSMQTVLHTISPGSRWGERLHTLLAQHPGVPLRAMGIPDNWWDDSFWRVAPSRAR